MGYGWHHDGMDGGGWWWLPGILFTMLIIGLVVWLVFAVTRRPPHHAGPPAPAAPAAPATPPSSAHAILADRLARGEIDVDDYRARLAALNETPPTATS